MFISCICVYACVKGWPNSECQARWKVFISWTVSPIHSTLYPVDSCKRELSADRSECKYYFHLNVINMELRLLWWNIQQVYSVMNFFSPNELFPAEWVSVTKIFFWPLVQVIAIHTWPLIKWYYWCVFSNLHKTICNFHFNFWHFFFL